MTLLQIRCDDRILSYTNRTIITSGDVNEDKILFDFSSEWDGFIKTAVFYRNEADVYHVLLDEENTCVIPHEVLAAPGALYFGVFGNLDGRTRTSEIIQYTVRQGAITDAAKVPDPTPDVYAQLMDRLDHALDNGLPHKLTFTGASTGEYDGTADVTINIPEIDTSLTVSGASADAKTVGEKLDRKTEQMWFERFLSKMGITMDDLLEKLPKVNLYGDLTGISADDYVNVTCNYVDEVNAIEFTDYAKIAWQGSSSLNNTNVEDGVDKAKNYKIKLYTDEARGTKSNRVFKDWHATNNFHIKANYGDCTNFMNNMMMHYLTKSYQYLAPLPRDGARYTVDGFPCLLYINDVFCGVRFWNLKQDDKVYKLNDENDLCYQIGLNNGSSSGDNSGSFVYGNLNSGSNEGKNFADAHAEIDYYWEDRVWDKVSNHPDILYNTIKWVSEATDEEFKANLEQYFDKEYLINYFVMMYTCGMGDSICKNFNMLYFPDKGKWYATFWDMDFAFGTGWGLGITDYTIDVLSSTYGASRLFTKLWANFADEIKTKYWELRETVLTVEQVKDSINAVWGNVSTEWITANKEAKYGSSTDGFKIDGASYVETWAGNRLAYMDTIMEIAEEDEISISAGYINDSGELTSLDGSYVRNDYAIIDNDEPVVSVKYVYASGDITMGVRIAEYDENKNFIKRHYATGLIKAGATVRYAFEPDENTRYIRIGVSNASTEESAKSVLENAFVESIETVELHFETGGIDSSGAEIDSGYWAIRSDAVEVDSETLSGWNGCGEFGVRCYTAEDTFSGTPTHIVDAGFSSVGVFATTAPSGTTKVRLLLKVSTIESGTYILLNGKKYVPAITA